MTYRLFWIPFGILLSVLGYGQTPDTSLYFDWQEWISLPPVGEQQEALGVAGPIAGTHEGVILVAGGANFDQPYWENPKVWQDDIWVFFPEEDRWMSGGKLNRPLAYSAVVSHPMGIIAVGGCDSERTYADAMLLQWDPREQKVVQSRLPDLPHPIAYAGATLIGDQVYVAGGTMDLDLATAQSNFWRLDLSRYGDPDWRWEQLPAWPGPRRAFNILLAQFNGFHHCIYLMSGRCVDPVTGAWQVLQDVYEFDPERYQKTASGGWRKRTDMPAPRMAGAGFPHGQSHLFVLSGADGTLYRQADSLRERHPGFPRELLAYHAITDTWQYAGQMPVNQLTTPVFPFGASFILASGEVKPRIRSPQIWKLTPQRTTVSFGWLNLAAIVFYLLILVGIGVYFSFRHKNTEDFFRGGQRIPWWAAGCSIFATMLSSVTFIAVPAKTYSTDWLYFPINMMIIAVAPFIIHYILPFFRKINATSAYEYLELRFNLATRLFGSASYILFQLGRMAIVLYLPALALAAVTPLSVEVCILMMGMLSMIYSALGGVEAVIWTDTLQTAVLLGGALLSLVLIGAHPEIGWAGLWTTAWEDEKFRMVDWDWSITGTGLWVILLGGIGQALIPYSSDQGVVQRYMSVSDEQKAAKSIWTNAGLSLVATILFFGVGTALYVYFKKMPRALDPTFPTDAVFPLYIARQLPVGIAGLVIAGIFAAAQSTVSTSMNSIATAGITDFARRFNWIREEHRYLQLARRLTVIAGLLGTGFALLIAYADIKSLWDTFIQILGLFGGAMCGLFLLGIFSKRANGSGALIGAVSGAFGLWVVQQFTPVSFLLYATIGISLTVMVGWSTSFLFANADKNTEGLTIYSRQKKED